MPPRAWFSTLMREGLKYLLAKYPHPHCPLLPLPSVPLRMVELPTRKSTGLLPERVEPGWGLDISALAMESGVLSTTLFTSSMGSGRLSKPCAMAVVSAQTAIVIVVNSRFIVVFSFVLLLSVCKDTNILLIICFSCLILDYFFVPLQPIIVNEPQLLWHKKMYSRR